MTEEAGEKKQEEIKRVVHTYPLIRVCCDFTSMCVDYCLHAVQRTSVLVRVRRYKDKNEPYSKFTWFLVFTFHRY